MKKKIDPQHYLTDAIIISDEWDDFDYDLKSNIEELGHIDYDSKPINWKKDRLGYGYLRYVENLLREKFKRENSKIKTVDDLQTRIKNYTHLKAIIKDIRELQTLIEKYDNLKIFLLTLRITTIASRVGFIPDLIQLGEKYSETQSKRLPKKRTIKGITPEMREATKEKIIEHFKKARLKNPRLKPSSFAKNNAAKHAAEYKLSPRSVRLILSKAVGS